MSRVGKELLWLHMKGNVNYQILLNAHESFLQWIILCPKGKEKEKRTKKKKADYKHNQ